MHLVNLFNEYIFVDIFSFIVDSLSYNIIYFYYLNNFLYFYVYLKFFYFLSYFLIYFRNISLPNFLEARSALQKIKGIGKWKSNVICARVGLMFPFFLQDFVIYPYILSWLFFHYIRFYVLPLDTVSRKINRKFKVLFSLKSYRSSRHRDFLPVRGQRTRTNMGTLKRLRQKQN